LTNRILRDNSTTDFSSTFATKYLATNNTLFICDLASLRIFVKFRGKGLSEERDFPRKNSTKYWSQDRILRPLHLQLHRSGRLEFFCKVEQNFFFISSKRGRPFIYLTIVALNPRANPTTFEFTATTLASST
jgi:hypothetical protein